MTDQFFVVAIHGEFKPFISHGFFSLIGSEVDRVPFTIQRYTGAKYSVARHGVVPFSAQLYCSSELLVWGIKLSVLLMPLHTVTLSTPLVSGRVRVAVRHQLLVVDVDLILRNDLAGESISCYS